MLPSIEFRADPALAAAGTALGTGDEGLSTGDVMSTSGNCVAGVGFGATIDDARPCIGAATTGLVAAKSGTVRGAAAGVGTGPIVPDAAGGFVVVVVVRGLLGTADRTIGVERAIGARATGLTLIEDFFFSGMRSSSSMSQLSPASISASQRVGHQQLLSATRPMRGLSATHPWGHADLSFLPVHQVVTDERLLLWASWMTASLQSGPLSAAVVDQTRIHLSKQVYVNHSEANRSDEHARQHSPQSPSSSLTSMRSPPQSSVSTSSPNPPGSCKLFPCELVAETGLSG